MQKEKTPTRVRKNSCQVSICHLLNMKFPTTGVSWGAQLGQHRVKLEDSTHSTGEAGGQLVFFGCFWCFWLFLVVFGCFEVYFLESHRSVIFRIPWKAAERPPRICDDFQRFRRESRPASWVDFLQQKKTYNFKKWV